jgi:hypothetical protein
VTETSRSATLPSKLLLIWRTLSIAPSRPTSVSPYSGLRHRVEGV